MAGAFAGYDRLYTDGTCGSKSTFGHLSYACPLGRKCKERQHNRLRVLSPYEAHALLPSICQHKVITLHVYSPRVSMSMRTLEDLSFCANPAKPKYGPYLSSVMQLNLFAGQLYLRSYDEYLSVCRFLRLCFRLPCDQVQVAWDGFIGPTGMQGMRVRQDQNFDIKTRASYKPFNVNEILPRL